MKNKDVPAENVTDRYAKKAKPKADTARVLIRVANAEKKRVAVTVTMTEVGNPGSRLEGKSRGESADTNDIPHFRPAAGERIRDPSGRR